MYINSILSIEATFMNIMFQSRKQEDLNEPFWKFKGESYKSKMKVVCTMKHAFTV